MLDPSHSSKPAVRGLSRRRELSLRCTTEGRVLQADAVAHALLGLAPDKSLHDLVGDGSRDKLRAFLSQAQATPLDDWELSFLSSRGPQTFLCAAESASQGELDVWAVLIPDHYGRAVASLNDAVNEAVELTRDLSRQRKELELKNQELAQAYRELDESNKGVVSLHSELAERNDTLLRASEVRARMVANVSHEFRTPLHSILGLSRLILDQVDGKLTPEQEKQIRFIRTSAEELSQLVSDMLDLSSAESGKAILRPQKFSLDDFTASLRGMLRPLALNPEVNLTFDGPAGLVLETDQGKLSQIVRNLVSNALKFTEQGEVKVTFTPIGERVSIAVSDTGVGIAPKHFDHIFEEFGQVENRLQSRVKGTGLGLPLSRKLAELLGGTLQVSSVLGEGSTFTLEIPRVHEEAREMAALEARPVDEAKAQVLVVEDDRKTIFIYEKFLAMAGFQVVPARDTATARRLLETLTPAAVVLDVMLDGESSWAFLADLKQDPRTRDVPVLVVTITNKEQKARALGADEFWLKPVDGQRLIKKLRSVVKDGAPQKVLVIDDDERARYLVRKFLSDTPYRLLEATTGPEGVLTAREEQPDVILLDFLLKEHTAFDVLDELKSDATTRAIPVVVVTSHALPSEDLARLSEHTESVISKGNLSRELAINRIRDALQKAGLGPKAQ